MHSFLILRTVREGYSFSCDSVWFHYWETPANALSRSSLHRSCVKWCWRRSIRVWTADRRCLFSRDQEKVQGKDFRRSFVAMAFLDTKRMRASYADHPLQLETCTLVRCNSFSPSRREECKMYRLRLWDMDLLSILSSSYQDEASQTLHLWRRHTLDMSRRDDVVFCSCYTTSRTWTWCCVTYISFEILEIRPKQTLLYVLFWSLYHPWIHEPKAVCSTCLRSPRLCVRVFRNIIKRLKNTKLKTYQNQELDSEYILTCGNQ